MRVAHWSLFAPSHSGMYHTTRDLLEAEREAGIEADFLDPFKPQGGDRDGDLVTQPLRVADLADVYCLHSRVDPPYYGDGTPIVFILHGHPLYTWQSELYNLEEGNPYPWKTSTMYFRDPTISRHVTFWPDQLGYWTVLDGPRTAEKVRLVPRGIKFGTRFCPEGEREQLTGDPVLVIADQFRLFKDSFAMWFAAAIFCRKYPEARLHLYVIPEETTRQGKVIRDAIQRSELQYYIGSINETHPAIEKVFRSADIVLSSVITESRVALEAMACGAEVVSQYSQGTWEACFRSPDAIAQTIERAWLQRMYRREERRQELHRQVTEMYDIRKTVAGLKAVFEELL